MFLCRLLPASKIVIDPKFPIIKGTVSMVCGDSQLKELVAQRGTYAVNIFGITPAAMSMQF